MTQDSGGRVPPEAPGLREAAEIRRQILQRRRGLSRDEVQGWSSLLFERFKVQKGLPDWKGRHVALYRPLPSEPQFSQLEKWLGEQGAILYYPRVTRSGFPQGLEFVRCNPSQTTWNQGPYGIEEPPQELPAVPPAQLEVILVPGVAFGLSGERIGMGAGYYDRFLPLCPDAIRIAWAFEFQIFERLPQNAWDQPVNWVITEDRAIQSVRL